MEIRREHIQDTLSDMVSDLLYYKRKEDDELPRGAIDEAVRKGEISIDEMVGIFRAELEKGIQA
jgi:hypothetical protein